LLLLLLLPPAPPCSCIDGAGRPGTPDAHTGGGGGARGGNPAPPGPGADPARCPLPGSPADAGPASGSPSRARFMPAAAASRYALLNGELSICKTYNVRATATLQLHTSHESKYQSA
jgi:hypothetical protein